VRISSCKSFTATTAFQRGAGNSPPVSPSQGNTWRKYAATPDGTTAAGGGGGGAAVAVLNASKCKCCRKMEEQDQQIQFQDHQQLLQRGWRWRSSMYTQLEQSSP
jgi:hypothetical protein